MAKKQSKWNRVHFFQEEKKEKDTRGKFREHPALIFGQSGKQYKAIVFTKNATTNGVKNEKLKHNVDPSDASDCYGVYYRGPRPSSDFQKPSREYRIHKDDMPTLKRLKAGIKKKK